MSSKAAWTRSEPVTLPRLGLAGTLRWIWTQLTSMSTALMLLLLLAVAAVPGSLVPQRRAGPEIVDQWIEDNPVWGPVLDALAAEYDEHQLSRLSLPGEREAWSRAFGDTLPPGTREVLDLGTGSGNVALLLAADGYDVTGIDLSSGMLAQARAKVESHPHPPTFLEADAADPPFPHGTMDAIVSRYLLWTLRRRRPRP